jgi:hypothetical protein
MQTTGSEAFTRRFERNRWEAICGGQEAGECTAEGVTNEPYICEGVDMEKILDESLFRR